MPLRLLEPLRDLVVRLVKDLQEKMMEGDYEHLIECFDETFGDYVDLVR